MSLSAIPKGLKEKAISLAKQRIEKASQKLDRGTRHRQKLLKRLIDSSESVTLVTALFDQSYRSCDSKRTTDQLGYILAPSVESPLFTKFERQ